MDLTARWNRWLARLLATGLVSLQTLQAVLAVDMNPLNYMAGATADTVREAETRVGLQGRLLIASDHYVYVFTDRGNEPVSIPVSDSAAAAAYLARQPRNTVVLWDDQTGYWWYHLTPEAIVACGYRMVWDQRGSIGSRLVPVYERWRLYTHRRLYRALGWGTSWRAVRRTVLVRE